MAYDELLYACQILLHTPEAEKDDLLKDYSALTSPLRSELTGMGFTITEDGKHYKLTCFNDSRCQTVPAKTASDRRSGKNNSAEIISHMF